MILHSEAIRRYCCCHPPELWRLSLWGKGTFLSMTRLPSKRCSCPLSSHFEGPAPETVGCSRGKSITQLVNTRFLPFLIDLIIRKIVGFPVILTEIKQMILDMRSILCQIRMFILTPSSREWMARSDHRKCLLLTSESIALGNELGNRQYRVVIGCWVLPSAYTIYSRTLNFSYFRLYDLSSLGYNILVSALVVQHH